MDIRAARWSLVFLGLLALAAAANDYDDYESEDAPPPPDPVKPIRASPLLRQARGSVIGRPGAKSTVTQKTTTEAPQPEYEDELEEEIAGEEEQPTTTTEAPKRGGLKTGVVRPFRSNADLIEALKKRRQQHQSGGASSGTTSTTAQPTSEKSFKGNRRGSSSNRISNSAADQTGSNSERKSTVNGRRFNARSGGSNQPDEAEPEAEEQPTRSRQFGRGRRF